MRKFYFLGLTFVLLIVLFMSFSSVTADNYENFDIPLPKAYPLNLFPLIDDYVVYRNESVDMGDHQKINIKYFTNTSIKEAVEFYQTNLKEINLEVREMLGSFILEGKIVDKQFKIRIDEENSYDNYQTVIDINIEGILKTDLFEQNLDGEIDLKNTNEEIKGLDNLPDDYPLDLLPIYNNSEITYVEKHDMGDHELLVIQFNSKDNKVMVNNFYETFLKNYVLQEKAQFVTGGLNYYLVGVANNYKLKYTIYDYELYYPPGEYSTIVNLGVENMNQE